MIKTLYVICFVIFMFVSFSYAQNVKDCSTLKYEDKNQLAPTRLSVKNISGQLKVEGNESFPFVDMCIALFDEKSEEFIFVKDLRLKSKFNLKKIPNGKYRLIIKDPMNFFCVANVPIEINNTTSKNRKIIVIMKSAGIDDCSYGKYEDNNLSKEKQQKCSKQ